MRGFVYIQNFLTDCSDMWLFVCLCTVIKASNLDLKMNFFLLVALKIPWAAPMYRNYLPVSPGKWQWSNYLLFPVILTFFSLRVTTLLADILWAEAPQKWASFRKVFWLLFAEPWSLRLHQGKFNTKKNFFCGRYIYFWLRGQNALDTQIGFSCPETFA